MRIPYNEGNTNLLKMSTGMDYCLWMVRSGTHCHNTLWPLRLQQQQRVVKKSATHRKFILSNALQKSYVVRHLNFRQISRRFTRSFVNSACLDPNVSHIMSKNMTNSNPLGFILEPQRI